MLMFCYHNQLLDSLNVLKIAKYIIIACIFAIEYFVKIIDRI